METREPIITDISSGTGMSTPEPNVRHVRVLLSPLLQDGLEGFAVGHAEIPQGQQGSRHSHPETVEVWMFYSGTGRAIVGDQEVDTGPGTVVYTPPGVHHQFLNTGDEPVKLYFAYVPSGPEQDIIEGQFR